MWIREESRQFLYGLPGTRHPIRHVYRSGRCFYNNPWTQDPMAPSYYFSFVSRAVLWDRGSHRHSDAFRNKEPRPPCSRFEAHMRACPSLIRPPRFPHTPHLPRSQVKNPHAPKPPRQRETQRKQNSLRHFSVILPSVPTSPYPSVTSPDPVISPTPSVHSETNPDVFRAFQVHSPNSEHTPIKQEDIRHRDVTLTETISPQIQREDCAEPEGEAEMPVTMTPGTPSTPVTPLTPMTPRTPDSLSDLSRPSSSQFSYSTNLNSSISNAPSVNQIDDSEEEYVDGEDLNSEDLAPCSSSVSDICFSSPDGAVFTSCSPPTSILSKSLQSFLSEELQNTNPPSNFKESPIIQVEDPVVRGTPYPNQATDVAGAPSPCPANLEFQSILISASPLDVRSDWKTCRWPILPPITPQRGSQGSRASLSSPVSCSQSDMFAKLEAAAPRSVSCQSLDHADCSDMESTSPTTDLSPGLAALTVGCDSGELGSFSRVQLLLLERGASESLEPPLDEEWNSLIEERGDYEPGLQVWSLGIPQHYQCTDPYIQVSSSVSLSVKHVPLGQTDIRSGTPGLSDAEDISRSSSWSLSCGSREDTPHEEKVMAHSGRSDLTGDELDLNAQPTEPQVTGETSPKEACPGKGERPATGTRHGPNQIKDRRRRHHRKMLGEKGEERKSKALQIYTKLRDGNKPTEPTKPRSCSRFEDFDFLAKYCIITPEKLASYRRAFETVDTDSDGYLSCFQVLLALKEIIPPELLTEEEEIYVYRILELVDFSVTEGLTDLRLFAVVASLAQKIATLDDFMRSLISKMDFKSLEMKLYKAKKLFLFLLEGQSEGFEVPQGCISAEQLLVELKAGGIREEHEEEVRRELRSLRSLDLLDFLAHLPLFILIHNSVITNPLDDSSNL